MARPLRLCYENARYHVIARSASDGVVFADDLDRELFLDRLDRIVERHRWICHAYCLMTTHYHLVVETPLANLPFGMQQLNGLHASGFNGRHGRTGHVFGSRYRSILIEDARYLLAACRYIVLNPVRAGICARPEEAPWSSYCATAGLAPTPRLLTVETILAEVGGDNVPAAQGAYREFVAAGTGDACSAGTRGAARRRRLSTRPLPPRTAARRDPARAGRTGTAAARRDLLGGTVRRCRGISVARVFAPGDRLASWLPLLDRQPPARARRGGAALGVDRHRIVTGLWQCKI